MRIAMNANETKRTSYIMGTVPELFADGIGGFLLEFGDHKKVDEGVDVLVVLKRKKVNSYESMIIAEEK